MNPKNEPRTDACPIAERARAIAERIEQLPGQMRTFVDQEERLDLAQVRKVLSPARLEFEGFPVVVFIEQNWTPDHAEQFVRRIFNVTDGVGSFIEALAAHSKGAPNDWFDRHELGKFFVVAKLTAAYVGDWADQIAKRETATVASSADDSAPERPAKIIEGYMSIFQSLEIQHRDQTEYKIACRALKRKSKADKGPIVFRDKKRPIVHESALVAWWNSQTERLAEIEKERRDRKTALDEGYLYGRGSTEVKPQISGYVRKRAN